MRTISRTTQFRRDYKRELRGLHRNSLPDELFRVTAALILDQPLAFRYRDHPLAGNWKAHRDCHLRPDLILIYRLLGDNELELVRLGSHAELEL